MSMSVFGRQISPLSGYRKMLEDEAMEYARDYILNTDPSEYEEDACEFLMLKYLRRKASTLNSSISRIGKKAVRAKRKLIALRAAQSVLGRDMYLSLREQVMQKSEMENRNFECIDKEYKILQIHLIEKTIVMLSRKAEKLASALREPGQVVQPFQMGD